MAKRTVLQGKACRLVATYFNGTTNVVRRMGTFETVSASIDRDVRRDAIADAGDYTSQVFLCSELLSTGATISGSGIYADEDAEALAAILLAQESTNMAIIGFEAAGTETSAKFSIGGKFISNGGGMDGGRVDGPASFNLSALSDGEIKVGPLAALTPATYAEAFA